MAKIDLSDYKTLYLKTAKEYIDNITLSYLKLSSNIQDKEAINTIHISSHSLKSQSQVMGFTNIVNLCLNIEKRSDEILKGITQIDNQFVSLLKKFIDKLNLEFSQIEKVNV